MMIQALNSASNVARPRKIWGASENDSLVRPVLLDHLFEF